MLAHELVRAPPRPMRIAVAVRITSGATLLGARRGGPAGGTGPTTLRTILKSRTSGVPRLWWANDLDVIEV